MLFLHVSVEERILDYRLKMRIDRDGIDFLNTAIEIVQPKEKPPERRTDRSTKWKSNKAPQPTLEENIERLKYHSSRATNTKETHQKDESDS